MSGGGNRRPGNLATVPTAVEFEQAATLLDAAADNVVQALGPIDGTSLDDVMRGGRLRPLVEAGLAVTSANVLVAYGQLAALAAEARSRAEVCRQYLDAIADYHDQYLRYEQSLDTDAPLRRPEWPAREHSWIET